MLGNCVSDEEDRLQAQLAATIDHYKTGLPPEVSLDMMIEIRKMQDKVAELAEKRKEAQPTPSQPPQPPQPPQSSKKVCRIGMELDTDILN